MRCYDGEARLWICHGCQLAGAFGAILWWVLGTAGIEKPPEANHELLVPEPAALPLEAPDDEAPPE